MDTNANEPVFPSSTLHSGPAGLTKREWMAGTILAGQGFRLDTDYRRQAAHAVSLAGALLKELNRTPYVP